MATKASRIALAGSNISSTGEVDADTLDNFDNIDFARTSGVSTSFISDSYNILEVRTDNNDDQSSTDGIFKISNGSAGTTKAELRWDESEDLVHVSYGDHGRHISIASNGNVGIGTGSTSPSATLDIAGTTKAEQYLLDGIDKSITESGNVTHIFVYDTRHDTDGGAWRKKTKTTSWYTETLNTSTRGSRREFPVVAIIVATQTYTTIYDGDDPDTPMWMVYPDPCWASSGTPAKVSWAAMNGVLTWASDYRGGGIMNMVNDHIYFFHGTNMYYKQYPLIKDRSDGGAKAITVSGINMGYPVRHSTVNHIAITVPKTRVNIDPNSGLPKPIIGLATNSGACIISDDVVYDASESATCNMVMFHDDDLWFDRADYENMHVTRDIGSIGADGFSTSKVYYTAAGVYPQLMVGRNHDSTDVVNTNAMAAGEYPSFGNPNGLAMIAENWEQYPIRFNRSRVAHINHVYNTGWMQGYCRSATMMDTDSSNLDQTNILTQQGFSATTSGVINQGTVSLNPDKVYRLRVTTVGNVHMVWTQNQANGVVSQTTNFGGLAMPQDTTSTTYITGATGWNVNSWNTGTISNYTITEAVADRTIYNKTFETEGTIQRSHVETGADIVAYHGFAAGNLLVCSQFNTIGTSDFHFTFWMKPNSVGSGNGNYWHAVSLGSSTSHGQGRSTGFSFKMVTSSSQPGGDTGYSPYFYSANGNDQGTFSSNKKIPLGQWSQVTAGRVGGRWVIYVNGKWFHSGSVNTYNISDTYMSLGGPQSSTEHGGDAHMTMFRLSHDWPTDAQLLKTYQEEKELFRPGAQGTLYGTSKEVTALASDSDTGLLHVGTSSGRSVMRGLTRVDNTTTAVATAIGASNGMVVEE